MQEQHHTKRQDAERLLDLDADFLDAQQQEGDDDARRHAAPAAGVPQREGHEGDVDDQEPRGVPAARDLSYDDHLVWSQEGLCSHVLEAPYCGWLMLQSGPHGCAQDCQAASLSLLLAAICGGSRRPQKGAMTRLEDQTRVKALSEDIRLYPSALTGSPGVGERDGRFEDALAGAQRVLKER